MIRVVGFVGLKGSGKDTAADILCRGGKAKGKIAFAGNLKNICSKVFDIPMQLFRDPVLKEREFSRPLTITSKHLRQIKLECIKLLPEFDMKTKDRLYNVDLTYINGIDGRSVFSPRELLQVIGTDFIRDRVYKDWHVKAAFTEKALEGTKDGEIYCIVDIRFVNEYKHLVEVFGNNFKCFYLDRFNDVYKDTHESELEILKVKNLIPEENVIINKETVESLEKTIKNLHLPERIKKTRGFKFNIT